MAETKNTKDTEQSLDSSDEHDIERDAQPATIADPIVELASANDRALRAQAELDNYRKRASREIADGQRYAAMAVLRDLLPVVDDIDRAIEAAQAESPDVPGHVALLEGIRIVRRHLGDVLAQHNCQRIEAEGAEFDPAIHEAVLQQPSDEHEPGTVMHVTKQGYLLHDRVVRPAQVIVAKSPDVIETDSSIAGG